MLKKRWRKMLLAFRGTSLLVGAGAWVLYVPTVSSYGALDDIPVQAKGYVGIDGYSQGHVLNIVRDQPI